MDRTRGMSGRGRDRHNGDRMNVRGENGGNGWGRVRE